MQKGSGSTSTRSRSLTTGAGRRTTCSPSPTTATRSRCVCCVHPGQWRSDDDFYRLAARWDGDVLSYRPPFGPWAELAAYDGERFVNVGSGRKRIFRRIAPDDVVAFNRDILKDGREAHDYRIRPDGSLAADGSS